MKARNILVMAMLGSAALAQSAPASQKVADKPQVKAAPVQVVQPKSKAATATPKSATTPAPKKNSSNVQAKPVQVKSAPAKSMTAKPAVKTAAPKAQAQKPATKKTPEQLKAEINAAVAKKMSTEPAKKEEAKNDGENGEEAKAYRGRRDPFVSVIMPGKGEADSANCKTGKKCLVIDQIVLKGIVQMKTGNIALVENQAKRPYVLHENDSLFNGSVQSISGDTIIFKQTVTDLLGHTSTKEVVKKVSAPAV